MPIAGAYLISHVCTSLHRTPSANVHQNPQLACRSLTVYPSRNQHLYQSANNLRRACAIWPPDLALKAAELHAVAFGLARRSTPVAKETLSAANQIDTSFRARLRLSLLLAFEWSALPRLLTQANGEHCTCSDGACRRSARPLYCYRSLSLM